MSYSQGDEEQHILRYFANKSNGKLLEIGAWDGVGFSNTRALIERGWSGVLVEPECNAFLSLLKNTEDVKDRVQLVNAAVSTRVGLQTFWETHGDAISSLDPKHVEKWSRYCKNMRSYQILPVSPETLYAYAGPVDFINLDVEGINWEIFRTIHFGDPMLKMICVEYDDHAEPMRKLATQHGFRELHKTAQNLIFVR